MKLSIPVAGGAIVPGRRVVHYTRNVTRKACTHQEKGTPAGRIPNALLALNIQTSPNAALAAAFHSQIEQTGPEWCAARNPFRTGRFLPGDPKLDPRGVVGLLSDFAFQPRGWLIDPRFAVRSSSRN